MTSELFRFTDDDARLEVLQDLDHPVAAAFEAACARLARGRGDPVVIDVSRCAFLCSACLAEIIRTYEDVKESGRSMRLIVSAALVSVFDVMGIRAAIPTEIATGD